MIKLIITLWIFILCIGSLVSIFVFVCDVVKWHLQEKHTKIISSAELAKINGRGADISERGNFGERGNDGSNDGTTDGSNDRSNDGSCDELGSGYNG